MKVLEDGGTWVMLGCLGLLEIKRVSGLQLTIWLLFCKELWSLRMLFPEPATTSLDSSNSCCREHLERGPS